MKIYLEHIVRVYKDKANSKDSLRNTDGHILVLATWAEMFDNSLDKKEKEDEKSKLKKIAAPATMKMPRKCLIKEHLIIFLILTICILLITLLPVFWVSFYQVHKHFWGQG